MTAKRSSAATRDGRAGRRPPSRQVLVDVGVAVEPGVEGHLDAVDRQDAPVASPHGEAPEAASRRSAICQARVRVRTDTPKVRLPVGRAGREAAEPEGVGGRPADVAVGGDVDPPAAQVGVAHGREGSEPVPELLQFAQRDGDRDGIARASRSGVHRSPPNSGA